MPALAAVQPGSPGLAETGSPCSVCHQESRFAPSPARSHLLMSMLYDLYEGFSSRSGSHLYT